MKTLLKRHIAAFIINWNGAADTLELLDSLVRCQSAILKISVVIVDNNSNDVDFQKLSDGIITFSNSIDIILRRNSNNVGVPAAYNQGIQLLGLNYDYYLRLDNDVTVSASGLIRLLEAMDAGVCSGIGIVGGNIKYYYHPDVDNGGATTFDLVRGWTSVHYPCEDVICDGVLGCIMLISGALVRKYAPDVFDSSLFICTDESELSLRAKRDGILTLYIAEQIGLHKSGVSTNQVKFLSNYYSARNWTLHRFEFVTGVKLRTILVLRFSIDLMKSVVRFRWAYPVGFLSGMAMSLARAIDRRVRPGN